MSPAYQRTLERLGCLRQDGPLTAGFTATFMREDSARLTDFWESVAHSVDILDLVAAGFLVEPRFRRVLVEGLDLTAVNTSRKDGVTDLAGGELAEAMLRAGAPGVVAAAYLKHASDRQGIVFCPNVESSQTVAAAFRNVGMTCEPLWGAMSSGERHRVLADYRAGRLQVVTNCSILGEGFDAPETSCIVIARPTLSKVLFRQQVGRGLRTHAASGKKDCLILDLVGSTGRNDLASMDDMLSTSQPVHVQEGETLTQAVIRTTSSTLSGDAVVSGTLESVSVDPWEAERRAKLSQGERDREDREAAGEPEPDEVEERARYVPVEHRSGWFLRSPLGRLFVPLTAGGGRQVGVVTLIPEGDRWAVVVALTGCPVSRVGVYDTETAVQTAMSAVMRLLLTGVERSWVDPDARWRRRRATPSRVAWLERQMPHVAVESVPYSGQVADWLALESHGRIADAV